MQQRYISSDCLFSWSSMTVHYSQDDKLVWCLINSIDWDHIRLYLRSKTLRQTPPDHIFVWTNYTLSWDNKWSPLKQIFVRAWRMNDMENASCPIQWESVLYLLVARNLSVNQHLYTTITMRWFQIELFWPIEIMPF